jgi:hypothetical protein
MTFEEIGEIIKNPEAFDVVMNWLSTLPEARVTWVAPRKEYIKVTAPLRVWETELQAEFYTYEDTTQRIAKKSQLDWEPALYNVASEYSLPASLHGHVSALFNTVQVPPPFRESYLRKNAEDSKYFREDLMFSSVEPMASSSSTVTVAKLNSFYRIGSNIGSSGLKQSVFETSGQSFSPSDLSKFQNNYGLTVQSAQAPYGYTTSSCDINSGNCNEGNLDIQYIMGIAQKVVSIYWYVSGSGANVFVSWITAVAAQSNPPQSNSISWGSDESVSLSNHEALAELVPCLD